MIEYSGLGSAVQAGGIQCISSSSCPQGTAPPDRSPSQDAGLPSMEGAALIPRISSSELSAEIPGQSPVEGSVPRFTGSVSDLRGQLNMKGVI